MVESSRPAIRIDLNDFKLHLYFKSKTQLTLHFNSPSRRFYLSVIALVVNEMKRLGKIKSISLQDHLDLLALLNESVGGAAGSSDKENLLPRVYIKWRNALPDLEEAPLFKVLGKKKEEGEGAAGKIYSFTDIEKDSWANLFDYIGSDENVRLRFAIDKIGIGLDETSIIFGDYRNGEAWDRFIASLKIEEKEEEKVESAPVEETVIPEPPAVPFSAPEKSKISWLSQYRWVFLVVVIGIVAAGIWRIFLSPARIEVASVDRMQYPLPDKPSIAVLPFVNLSEDPKQEYFVEGMMDDLTTDLSKISGLLVIARNSTLMYKGKSLKPKQIAEDLGVRYILEGSVRRAGDEVRVNAQLIDALTGHHLWAERYDGTMGKIFALQDKITQKIVSALAIKLTGAEKQMIAEKGTDNVEAYDAFLRGWVFYLRWTLDDLVEAVQSFKKAIELDPNYAQALAGLALAYRTATGYGGMDEGLKVSGVSWAEARMRAVQYLKLAMKNPTSIAHHVNGLFYLWRRQHEEAVSEYERALALDPNDPTCNSGIGSVLMFSGKPKESIDFINRAIRLDPHNPVRYLHQLGQAQFCMGNLEEAATLFEKLRRLSPETWLGAPWLASIYGLLGRKEDARLQLEKGGGFEFTLLRRMYVYPFKDRAVADRFAEGLIKAGLKGPPSGYLPAFKENQLTGEEIKRLLFDSKITGIDIWNGRQWLEDRGKNGEFTWHGRGPISSDTGLSRIEGDMICTQYQKRLWGVEFCATVFRNPKGTYESKDEYFFCSDMWFTPFSLAK
jgi:TolB-like protein/Flp pilus assembly protein TadD